jgi:flagellar biogenesis protein FliO
VARCPLEPRRSVYLIETAGRCFLVGVGDGPMSLLAEVDGTKVEAEDPGARSKFSDVLARVLARPARTPTEPKAC